MAIKRQQTNHNLYKCKTKKPVLEPGHQIEQSSIPVNQTARPTEVIYLNRIARERSFFNEKQTQIMGYKLIEWALNQPRNTKLMRFFWPLGIHDSTVTDLCEKFPEFAQDVSMARAIIGGNLWDGALFADSGMREGAALKYLPYYDKEYKAETERMARLRTEEKNAEASKTLNVYMTEARSPEEREEDERNKQGTKT